MSDYTRKRLHPVEQWVLQLQQQTQSAVLGQLQNEEIELGQQLREQLRERGMQPGDIDQLQQRSRKKSMNMALAKPLK